MWKILNKIKCKMMFCCKSQCEVGENGIKEDYEELNYKKKSNVKNIDA
tara:strand:- start:1055 stop:1198 length:144 start_codon:yes stop_codon:yes gene_type:complete